MRINPVWATLKKHSGFTLIEVLIGVAISALLVVGVTTAISQVVSVNASNSSRMVAIKQLENAIDVLRSDTIVAQKLRYNFTSGNSTDVHVLQMSWVTWELVEEDTETHVITYDLNSAKELVRTESITNAVSGNATSTSRVVAKYIKSVTVDNYTDGKIRLNITASPEGFRAAIETRTLDILQRPAF